MIHEPRFKTFQPFKPLKPPPLFLPRDAGEDEGGIERLEPLERLEL
jgi:hypothetical protein